MSNHHKLPIFDTAKDVQISRYALETIIFLHSLINIK